MHADRTADRTGPSADEHSGAEACAPRRRQARY